MTYFHYQDNELYAEEVNLTALAKQYGTPCYVYSKQAICDNWQAFDKGLKKIKHRICYAVKANSNIHILKVLATLGSGFDIVSQGELERVLAAGGDPKKIVFSGVGKSTNEIAAALAADVDCFDVESLQELERINKIAKQHNKIAQIALRINPNIDAKTHPYISTGMHENKFGITMLDAFAICKKINIYSHVKLIGIAAHIGSQLTELAPFAESITCLLDFIERLKTHDIFLQHLNIGGGLGVRYQNELPPSIEEYMNAISKQLSNTQLYITLEPGRAIVANAGILLTRVEYIKHSPHKNFAIVDAGMNDLMRPALYEAWHPIIPVIKHANPAKTHYDIVGPVCESADFLGKNRLIEIKLDDILAVMMAGAYSFCMSSNYNSRPRLAEILVDGDKHFLIRRRETIHDLLQLEKDIKE
ncbi:diaminopimelate decarboxylase [Gammaproteobacteria bacterium SCGC AG-212-F23]|nr:diaminopimelate decarboxylase [Gammaproteobacteria bacterium SCGC AG-212-F23]